MKRARSVPSLLTKGALSVQRSLGRRGALAVAEGHMLETLLHDAADLAAQMRQVEY